MSHSSSQERWYDLDELAKRWGLSSTELRERVRRGDFDRLILHNFAEIHFIWLTPEGWSHGKLTEVRREGTITEVDRLMPRERLPASGLYEAVSGLYLVSLPEGEVVRYEQANEITPPPDITPQPDITYRVIMPSHDSPDSRNDDTKLIAQLRTHFYTQGHLDTTRSTINQMSEYLQQQDPTISNDRAKRLARAANADERPGRKPSQAKKK